MTDINDLKVSARKWVKRGGELAGTFVHLSSTTTSLGRVGAVLGAASVLLGEAPDLASRYERCEVLEMPAALHRAIFRLLLDAAALEPCGAEGKQYAHAIEVGPGRIVWIHERGNVQVLGPWLVNVDKDQAVAALGRKVWETVGSRVIVEVRRWGDEVEILADDLTKSQPSGLSRDLAAELALYSKHGTSRAVLLHGPSRTGKSYVVRDVAEALGSYSLRFSSVGWGGESLLVAAVKLLRPKTLIIDDICRTSTTTMLDAMERIRSVVPVVLATANYTENMDPAILGPGRFDRSIFVERMDQETFDAVTAGIPDDVRARLREAPVGYVSEFVTEMSVEGLPIATARLDELLERAAKVKASGAPVTAVGNVKAE